MFFYVDIILCEVIYMIIQGKNSNGQFFEIPFEQTKKDDCIAITVKKEDYMKYDEIRTLTDMGKAKAGDGYFVIPALSSGILQYFNIEDEDFTNAWIPSVSFYGVKTPEQCFMVIIEGMRYEIFCEYSKNGEDFSISFLLKLKEYHIEAYEDITLFLYHLPLDSTYNTMAAVYRNYKYSNGLKTINEKNLPDVFYASEAPEIRVRMAWKPVPSPEDYQTEENEPEVHIAVTFKKLIELMENMKSNGIEKAHFCLVGWNKSGHDGRWPQYFPVEEKLGGEEGLKEAIKRAKELGYKIVAHTNSSDAYTIANNFDINSIVQNYDGTPATGTTWSGGKMHFLCAKEALKQTNEFLPEVKRLGFEGVHYIDVLSIIRPYYCYHKDHPANRKETCLLWKEMLRTSREIFGGCASEGSYDIVAEDLDFVLYCGAEKFLKPPFKFTYKIIPLWELVYHGAIMACPSSELVNVGIIDKKLQLKFIEFGGRPAMYIHSRFVTESKDRGNWMGSDDLYLATEKDMEHTIDVLKSTVEFYEPLKKLQKEKMLEHTQLTNDIVKITYENYIVYVNYGESITIDGIKIDAMDYKIIDKF